MIAPTSLRSKGNSMKEREVLKLTSAQKGHDGEMFRFEAVSQPCLCW